MHCHRRRNIFLTALAAMFVTIAAAASPAPAGAAAGAQGHYRDKNFDYFVAGDPALPRAAHTEFTLALMGGGGIVNAAYAAIASHARGGHIVILRAVSDDSFDPADGDQGNYIRYWKGTPVQAALNAHVLANRPIGGSSAGLAILGHYSYTCLDGQSMESKTALADPFHPGVTIESDFLHLRWLESVITDTHFSARSRLGRLIVFVARINQEHPSDRVFGIGVDEKSALLIGADGVGRLAEGSAGSAWVVTPQEPASILVKGQPLTLRAIRIVRLDPKSGIDLRTRETTLASAEVTDSIEHGAAAQDALTSPMMMRSVVPPDEG